MDLKEEIAREIAPEDFRLAEHWLHYAFRMGAAGWFALEYTGRYLVGVQRAYTAADRILQLITTRLTSEQAVTAGADGLTKSQFSTALCQLDEHVQGGFIVDALACIQAAIGRAAHDQ